MKAFRFQFHGDPHVSIVFHETRDKAVNSCVSTLLELNYEQSYMEALGLIKSRHRAPEYDALAKSQPKGRALDERYIKTLLKSEEEL